MLEWFYIDFYTYAFPMLPVCGFEVFIALVYRWQAARGRQNPQGLHRPAGVYSPLGALHLRGKVRISTIKITAISPVMTASKHGHFNVVAFLFYKGANIHDRYFDGRHHSQVDLCHWEVAAYKQLLLSLSLSWIFAPVESNNLTISMSPFSEAFYIELQHAGSIFRKVY